MNWQLYTFTCLNGHAFTEAELPVVDYGTLVKRVEQSVERRLLNALEDPVFAEVDALLADTAAGHLSAPLLGRHRAHSCQIYLPEDPHQPPGRAGRAFAEQPGDFVLGVTRRV